MKRWELGRFVTKHATTDEYDGVRGLRRHLAGTVAIGGAGQSVDIPRAIGYGGLGACGVGVRKREREREREKKTRVRARCPPCAHTAGYIGRRAHNLAGTVALGGAGEAVDVDEQWRSRDRPLALRDNIVASKVVGPDRVG